jgi:hypothetical protein
MQKPSNDEIDKGIEVLRNLVNDDINPEQIIQVDYGYIKKTFTGSDIKEIANSFIELGEACKANNKEAIDKASKRLKVAL